MSYKTNTEAQLWTKTGNKAGTTRIGVILEVSGVSKEIRDTLCGRFLRPTTLENILSQNIL